jgi:hypothetical protein
VARFGGSRLIGVIDRTAGGGRDARGGGDERGGVSERAGGDEWGGAEERGGDQEARRGNGEGSRGGGGAQEGSLWRGGGWAGGSDGARARRPSSASSCHSSISCPTRRAASTVRAPHEPVAVPLRERLDVILGELRVAGELEQLTRDTGSIDFPRNQPPPLRPTCEGLDQRG